MKNREYNKSGKRAYMEVNRENYQELWDEVLAMSKKNKELRDGLKALGLIQ